MIKKAVFAIIVFIFAVWLTGLVNAQTNTPTASPSPPTTVTPTKGPLVPGGAPATGRGGY